MKWVGKGGQPLRQPIRGGNLSCKQEARPHTGRTVAKGHQLPEKGKEEEEAPVERIDHSPPVERKAEVKGNQAAKAKAG